MQEIPNDILSQVKTIDGCDGIIYTGSRQQGSATDSSDWDFYVLLDDGVVSFRKTWIYKNTFVEVFCNTLESINENDLVTSKISNPSLRMLATGTILQDKSGRLANVQAQAKQIYFDGPPVLDEETKLVIGYILRTMIDDLRSLKELTLEGYHLQNSSLVNLVENFYKLEQRWMAKPRQIEQDITSVDSAWSKLYIEANESTGQDKTEKTIGLAEMLISKHALNASGEIYRARK